MLYTKKDAGRLLNVSEKTIERAMAGGSLKCRRIGSFVRFAQEDLDEYIGVHVEAVTEKTFTPEGGYLIPGDIIKTLEKECRGISHGSVTLTIHLRDSRPRFVIGRERSFLQDEKEAGGKPE